MSTYCEGTNCSKRNECALHCVAPGNYEYLDWSTYGSGRYWNDPDGTPRCEVDHSCGDLGNFKHFKKLTTENKE